MNDQSNQEMRTVIEALVAAINGLVPRCRFVVDRNVYIECGQIATLSSSFGMTQCEQHPFKSGGQPIEQAIAARDALKLAESLSRS